MTELPRQTVARVTLACFCVFSVVYVAHVIGTVSDIHLSLGGWALLASKTAVELVAAGYGIAYTSSAIAFLLMRDATAPDTGATPRLPRIGLVYLCCDDADADALESLALLSYTGPLALVIHDDGRDPAAHASIDSLADRLRNQRDWDVRVLRRPERVGGKAGAVNYVLDHSGHLYDFWLLCDNDSTVLDPATVDRALNHMRDDVAIVQLRSVPVENAAYCSVNRRLAESIGAFHAFLAPASRYGWMPFIGHNALLRTQAVQSVGGLTPGFFSDDLDLTVRLNLAGYRVVYAPDVRMGEKHPPSYTAFRKRSYKWAYGCVQTLRAHSGAVLRSPRFTLAEKVSFFQFAGFYCLQSLLLSYLAFALVAIPLGLLGQFAVDPAADVFVGTVLVGLIYAPLSSFYIREREARRAGWGWTLVLCGLVYGGTDFPVLRGVFDAVRGRRRPWAPTNAVTATTVSPALFVEAAFGLTLLLVPLALRPEELYLACWFLFAGKFLFGPALTLLYRDRPDEEPSPAVVAVDDDGRVIGPSERPAFNGL
jgi:GT2 family glycosyltransferase